MVLALIVAVLILGWAVMRSPTEIEEKLNKLAATYEVDEVQSYGGVLGMINTLLLLRQVYCPKKNAEVALLVT